MIETYSKVRLKSGGPVMLVACYAPKTKTVWFTMPSPWGCYCVWMNKRGEKQSDWFDPELLDIAL